jgi:hypothetical protein
MRSPKHVAVVNLPTGISPCKGSPMPPVAPATLDDNPYRELDLCILCDLFELYEEDTI